MFILVTLLKILIIIVPLLISVAYFTLAERKILGVIQRRRGPNVIGVYGLLQPLADGFKLLVKETIIPSSANKFLFILSPIITFLISLMGWAIIPFDKTAFLSEINIGILYIFAISSLGVYGIIMSGWSSNSKYAFLGALRSFNLQTIISSQQNVWFILPFFPLFLLFFISGLAETNRHPFDLPEAETELVSGYNVEYSAMGFALFSLGEYANMLLMSSLNIILFFGGWLAPLELLNFIPGSIWFGLKICFFVILFSWMRAALPRYRYDQLMGLGWKVFLPISVSYLIVTFLVLISFNMLPY